MPWQIAFRPEGKNENHENSGGVVVYLVNGSVREEVGRVAFDRESSANPNAPFEEMLSTYGNVAKFTAETLSTLVSVGRQEALPVDDLNDVTDKLRIAAEAAVEALHALAPAEGQAA